MIAMELLGYVWEWVNWSNFVIAVLTVIITVIIFKCFSSGEHKRGRDEYIKQAIDRKPGGRGLACIIANDYFTCEGQKDLPCAIDDSEVMKSAFSHLNFATIVIRNAAKNEMKDSIQAIALYQKYPKEFDCFSIVFSGHGRSERILISDDNKEMDLNEIMIKPFDNKKSCIETFPKLLFIDACRGGHTKGPSNDKLSKPANFLIAYSTRYGYVSYGDKSGSIWIRKLAAALIANTTKSIGDVVISVNNEVTRKGDPQPECYNTNVDIVLSSKAGIESKNETTATPWPTESHEYDTDSHKHPLDVTGAFDLACFNNCVEQVNFEDSHGKWILFRNFKDLNNTWCVVRDEIEFGRLGAIGAKCSTRRYDPASFGAGPKTVGRISVFTKENDIIDVGMKLIRLQVVHHDIKYKKNETTRNGNYVHDTTSEEPLCSKFIFWNSGDAVSINKKFPAPCIYESFKTYVPTLDEWKINIVSGEDFEDKNAHGKWIVKIKNKSQLTKLWHGVKDKLDNKNIRAFKMECPYKYPKSDSEIHVFTTEPTMYEIGSELITEVKCDICYNFIVAQNGRTINDKTYFWNNGQPGFVEEK